MWVSACFGFFRREGFRRALGIGVDQLVDRVGEGRGVFAGPVQREHAFARLQLDRVDKRLRQLHLAVRAAAIRARLGERSMQEPPDLNKAGLPVPARISILHRHQVLNYPYDHHKQTSDTRESAQRLHNRGCKILKPDFERISSRVCNLHSPRLIRILPCARFSR